MKPVLPIILILAILSTACTSQSTSTQTGTLKGTISIGPLCPVERIPPDPRCQPTEATYKAWQVAVWKGNTQIVNITPSLNGSYELNLSEGNYVVNFASPHPLGGKALPEDVAITPDNPTVLNISIDTGIR